MRGVEGNHGNGLVQVGHVSWLGFRFLLGTRRFVAFSSRKVHRMDE